MTIDPADEAKAIAELEALAPRPVKATEEAYAERARILSAMQRFEEYMSDTPPKDSTP